MTFGFVMLVAFTFVVLYACFIRARIKEYLFIRRMKRYNDRQKLYDAGVVVFNNHN